jgi:hypothetical protein
LLFFQLLAGFGTFKPGWLPESWPLEMAFAWAVVLDSIVLPICLATLDSTLRDAIRKTFSRKRILDYNEPVATLKASVKSNTMSSRGKLGNQFS